MEFFNIILEYYFIPILGWLMYLHIKHQEHQVEISVIKSQQRQDKENSINDREKLNEVVIRIYSKLDKIEEFLRERK